MLYDNATGQMKYEQNKTNELKDVDTNDVVLNRECIDSMSDYDTEHQRITKSVHHRLDLGPISLPGAQQHATVESAAALKIQDKIEGKFKSHI